MQIADAIAAGVLERERQQRVHEASESAAEHARRKAHGRAQVLQVALTHRCRMLCEQSPDAHAGSVGNLC
ncbi:MAG: hypothetical protein IRZ28_09530 [Steroidobacteraceae bacterium]|nr:hypothetical protein [Steroidobacteraceae bacterium]